MISGEDGFARTQEPAGGRDAWIAFVPVQGGELSLAVVYPQAALMAEALALQVELLVLGVAGLLVMLIALIFMARSISRPIQELAVAAQEVAAGRLDYKFSAGSTIEEVRDLTYAFHKMTRDLQMRMQELRYNTTVTERLQGELSGARSIQMSLLPKVFPAFPERPEIDIHAVVRPAREVGGDFYDFYFLDERRLCVAIGDVSGKGIGAALFMAVTKTLLKSKSSPALSPSQIVQRVNREVCEGGDNGMFVTLVYALLDTHTGEFEFCNAGHLPPLQIAGESGEITQVQSRGGIALGLMPEAEYPTATLQMAPGDTLVFFTDGITEALDPERNFFAALRLRGSLEGAHTQPVAALTRNLVQDVRNFCGGREQADDIAVLALRWNGPPAGVK
jgi:sigma-B regulation protein RsbU (phosphoserine phosphatase)